MAATMHRTETPSDERQLEEPLPAEWRLAESRAEIEELLNPGPGRFPRSQTMRFLMGRNGKAVTLGAFAALLAFKPRLALSLARFLPLGPLVRRFL